MIGDDVVVIYYVEIGASTFAITNDGLWIAVVQEDLDPLITTYNINAEDILINDNSAPYLVINEKAMLIPDELLIKSNPSADEPLSDNQSPENQNLDTQSNTNEGLSYFYQIIQTQYNSLIAQSGYTTSGDSHNQLKNEPNSLITQQDSFITLTLSINIDDANDGFVNRFEVPKVDISGGALDAIDGQILSLVITDIEGRQLSVEVIVTDEAWHIDGLDLSSLTEGVITAEISAPAYQGIAEPASDITIKDTLADIDIDVNTGRDDIINRFEMLRLDFNGTVTDVEDGQPITITLTDSLGIRLSFNTTILNGVWAIDNANLATLSDGNITFVANTVDVAGNPTSTSMIVIKDTKATISIEAVDKDNTLNSTEITSTTLQGETHNIEDGQNVLVWVTDSHGIRLTFNTTVADGQWQLDNLDLSSLAEGELILRALTADAEGNPSIGNNTVEKDTLADITIEIIDNDGVINAAEIMQVIIQGTISNVEDGQTVTVNLTDNQGHSLTLTAIVTASSWALSAQDLSIFDDGSLIATATVSDVAGNTATAQTQLPIDTTADITIEIIDNDGVINTTEMMQVIIQGTVSNVEDGQTVTINLTDNQGHSLTLTTIVTAGSWALSAQDLSAFDDGSLTATATVNDVAGNPATAQTQLPVDTTADITIEIIDNDGVINAAEMRQVIIQGTVSNVEDGQTVTVNLTDNQGHSLTLTAMVTAGSWALSAQDLSGFDDGSLLATATVNDMVGNPATAQTVLPVDILADIDIDVDTGRDDIINRFEMLRLDFTGTVTDVEDGQSITITLTDSLGAQLSFNTTVLNGTWAIDNANVSTLADGDITFVANTVDVAGNPTSTTTIVTKDSQATVTIEAVDSDNTFNNVEVTSTTLRGEALNIEDGQNVLVWVTDINGIRLTFNTTVTDGQWQLDNLDLSSLAEGELTLRALTADVEGNPSIGSNTVEKDTLADITIEIIDIDGVINAAEMMLVVIQGTVSNVEDGQTVTVNLTDNQGHSLTLTAMVTAGSWTLSAQDLSAFDDGSLVATATVNDLAGNLTTAQTDMPVDILADIDINVNTGRDDIINRFEMLRLDFTGTVTDVEDGQSITITLTDSLGAQLSFNTTVLNGAWAIDNANVATLADGIITFVATTVDIAGNPAMSSTALLKDTIANVTINVLDSDQIINQQEIEDLNTIFGIANNIEDGQTIFVTITDSLGQVVRLSSVIFDGIWTLSGLDASGLADGPLKLYAVAIDAEGNPAFDSNTVIKDTMAVISVEVIDNDGVLNATEMTQVAIQGSVANVEDGQTVIVTLTDNLGHEVIITTVVINGVWSLTPQDLSSFEDGNLLVTAEVYDIAGNLATSSTLIPVDTTAVIDINFIDSDGVINAAEITNVILHGSVNNVENGQNVTVILVDNQGNSLTLTTTINAGQWALPAQDLSIFDEASLLATATVTDLAGNTATSSLLLSIDTLADITIEIIDNDGVINAAEMRQVIIQGTVSNVEDGQTVTVNLTDNQGHSLTLTAMVTAGSWALSAQDLSAFDDGSLVATATVNDVAGNPATAQADMPVDILADIDIDVDTGRDDIINRFEMLRLDFTGTVTDVEDGQSITITLTDSLGAQLSFNTTVLNGVWAIDNANVSTLVDGDITFVANTVDVAGNPTSTTTIVIKDSQATVTIEAVDTDNTLNITEITSTSLRGVALNIEDGQNVLVWVTDSNGGRLTFNTTVVDGLWQLDNLDLSTLAEGELTLRALSVDVEGNPSIGSNTVDKDTLADITVEIIDNDAVLNEIEMSQVVIQGTVVNVEDGQTVTVFLTDNFGHSLTVTAIVTAGTWTLAAQNLSTFDDGSLVVTASVNDAAGNPASAQTQLAVDTTATIDITITDNDGVINTTEMSQVVISGTVTNIENNQTVTVYLTDNQGHSLTLTTTVIGGSWSLPAQDLSDFDDGSLVAIASVNDRAGNPATAQAEMPVDILASITIDIIDNDNVVNQTELSAVVVSGTVTDIEAGQDIKVTLTDINNVSTTIMTTVLAGGTWLITAQDLVALGFVDGLLTASATATDAAGNTITAIDTILIDTQVTIDIDTGADGFDVGLFTYGKEASLAGTTTGAEEGQTVTLTLTDGAITKTFTTAVKADGSWIFDNTLNVEGLDQRLSWQMKVSVTDAAGNTAVDEMPQLDIPDDGYLYELALNINNQTSTQFSFDNPNAELTLSTDQAFLLRSQSNGQDLSIVLAADGLSFQVFRDGDNELVLEATLTGTDLIVTLFQTLDNPAVGNLSTIIRLEGLQTDTDGTTESIVTYAILHIRDTPELAIDDNFTTTEDTTLTGSITGNDYTIEGPLNVESINFNGTSYAVAQGSPAIIDTGKGQLTVLYNGFWEFIANDNLDNTLEQSISFDYTVSDFDGSIASATSTITIVDGAIGMMADANFPTAESTINSPNTDSKSFSIIAGSDTLIASSVVFSTLSLIPLNALGLTSNGDALTYSLSADAKSIIATANGVTIFNLSLSAINNGDDVEVTAIMDLSRPLDHNTADALELATLIDAIDLDGSHIDLGSLKWAINDGATALIDNVNTLTFDESNLTATSLTQSGQFDINVGADAISSLGFDISQMPTITAGGEAVTFEISANGLLLTAHTGNIAEPIFTIEIDSGWNTESDTESHSYTTSLYRPFDQIETEEIDFGLIITDFDGDTTQANMTLIVKDDTPGQITDIDIDISELPSVTPGINNRSNGFIDITTNGDPIVNIKFSLSNDDLVVDVNGNTITQNGIAIHWVISNGGATAEGQTPDGNVIFRLKLPTDIHIDAESSAQVAFEMQMLGAIDNNTAEGLFDTLEVGVIAIDSDKTRIHADINIDIFDGELPYLPASLTLNIDEGELVDNTSVLSSAILNIDNGSDDIASIELTDSFNFGAYTSNKQPVELSNISDSNGWYNAIRTGDNNTVFRVRFNTNGKVEFEQFEALDHPDGNTENKLSISFDIIATDADGDKSNSQTINIDIKDDVPIQTNSSITFTEEDNEDFSVNMFNQKQQGADGAVVSKFTYAGSDYLAGESVDLFTDTGVKYGSLVISADGTATVTSKIFEYDELFYTETVQVYVTDKDGDTVIDNLTITANDKSGSIRVLNPNFIEDTPGALIVAAFPGDIDEGELIESIVFNTTSLGGGTLTLDGIPVPTDADGNYILEGINLYINDFGIAIPSGNLLYHPAEDASDATLTINVEITVNINNKPAITTQVPFTIESVADTPEWEDSSQFTYDINEDAGAIDIELTATSKDSIGADSQGSEVITYVINSITPGLVLTSTNSDGVTFSIASGQIITADELALLQATVSENLAGQFSFDIQATTTEPDNGATANSTLETITFNVSPVADLPTLTTRDINSDEDQAIALADIIYGELTDTSGSESLHFELTLPDGWIIDAPSAINLGNGVWTVAAQDINPNPPAIAATIIPLADASSANMVDFTISVRSYATETAQDGSTPVDSVINPNPHYSDSQTLTISLTGVANDVPTISSDPNVWQITSDGNINSVTPFDEDTDIPLSFTLISSDNDGSESLSIRLVGLPEGASFVDANGNMVNLPVVGFDDNQPVYSVTAAILSTLSIRPPEDFSGQINLSLIVESTELDGDVGEYELNLNIDIAPVIDETADSLQTISTGKEDQPIVLNLPPALLADIDGSETITDVTIFPSDEGMILLFDGAELTVGSAGLLLSSLTDEFSPTLMDLLNSGRLAVLPPQDADGPFTLDVSYQITDTSESGQTVVQDITSQLTVQVDAVVEVITRLQVNNQVLYSNDGQPITLSDEIVFFDGDIDGSEVLDYIVINMPSADGWYVTHPNGAINDGDGRWIIPTYGMTSDSIQEQSMSILDGVTISSDHSTGLETITVEARVLDRDDPEIISANVFVLFDQATSTSTASVVSNLQASTVDAIEDNSIDFAGHLNLSITNDNNDFISFRVLASDLPEGGYFTGSDVIALYDASGENIIEYVFTTASLNSLQLHSIQDNFAGDLIIPIRIIATDSLSGDTEIDDSQSLDINITPVADGLSLNLAVNSMNEDNPIPLGLSLSYIDTDSSANNGGAEKVILNDSSQPFTIQLLDGGTLIDNSGLFQLQAGSSDTWEFTGSTNVGLNNALALLQFSPPEHLSGDFRFKITGAVSDTADIDGGNIIDEASFSDTVTIHVNPITDAADIPADLITIAGLEDTDIALTGINSSAIGLIDTDGSEVLYITLNGVPEGATVYFQDASGNLQLLPNDGPDGNQLNGVPTSYWTVTAAQLDGLVIKPPHNFNGDMPLSLSIITQELGTDDYVTTTMDFLIGVSPVADGVQIISEPEDYNGIEGDVIKVELAAELLDLEGHEVFAVDFIITSTDASALVNLDGIQIGDQFATLTADGNGGYIASFVVDESSLSEIKILPGELAFGTLNVEMVIASIDTAEVLGAQEVNRSDSQTISFDIELTPEVDAPIWTQFADFTTNLTDNIALNLGLELQNPAPNETATLTILGVPDGMTLSAGTQQGNKWIVDIEDVASLTLSGANDGDVIELSLDPIASLGTDVVDGVLETITITVDTSAVMANAAIPMNSNIPVEPEFTPETQLDLIRIDIMQEMYERMQYEQVRRFEMGHRSLAPTGIALYGDTELMEQAIERYQAAQALKSAQTEPVDTILPIDDSATSDEQLAMASATIQSNTFAAHSKVMQHFVAEPELSTKPEYGYQDPLPINDAEPAIDMDVINTIEFSSNLSANNTALVTNQISSITLTQESGALSLIEDAGLLIDSHLGDKLIHQPGFGFIQPVPDAIAESSSHEQVTESEALLSLTEAIKHSIASQQDFVSFGQHSEPHLSQSELDEINQLAAHQALINQS